MVNWSQLFILQYIPAITQMILTITVMSRLQLMFSGSDKCCSMFENEVHPFESPRSHIWKLENQTYCI